MTRDQLASFWVHEVQVARLLGNGAYGPTYENPSETITAFVDTPDRQNAGSRLVTNAEGQQVVSSVRIYAPSSVADVPPGSVITLPVQFGGRQATVIAFARRELPGTDGVPAHIELDLQ
jgi:hypothetical protein